MAKVQALRKAFGYFYDQQKTTKFSDQNTGLHFDRVSEFVDYLYSPEIGIPKGTSVKHIGITLESWYETLSKTPEFSEPTTTEVPIYQASSTTPDKWASESQEAERQKREVELRETKEHAEKEVNESIRKKQELYEEQVQEVKIRETLAEKKVIVTPKNGFTEVTLTPQEKSKIYNLAKAIKADPVTTQKIIEAKIQESVSKSAEEVKKNISPFIVNQASKDLSEKLNAFAEYKKPEDIPDKFITYNQASPFAAIINKNDNNLQEIIPDSEAREGLTKSAQAIAISLESENNVYGALNEPLFEYSKNISSLFYPKQVAEFQISEGQNEQQSRDEGIEINLESVYKQGNNIWDVWRKLANKETTVSDIFAASPKAGTAFATTGVSVAEAEAAGYTLPIFAGSIVGLGVTNTLAVQTFSTTALAVPGSQITQMIIGRGASQLVQTSALMMGNVDKIFFNAIIPSAKTAIFVGKGLTIGGEKMLAAGLSIGKSKIALAITAKGISVAATGAFASAIGFLATPIGGLVIAAGTWLVSKVAPWVKKNAPYLIGTVIGLGAFAIAGPLMGVVAGIGAFGLASAAAGGTISLGAIGASIGGLFTALGGIIIAPIAMPILITLLSLPVIVALILFIINSGAYVVPPTATTGLSSNPYIQVDKVVNPAGPFQNSNLPLKISYNVKITAKKSTLTNISIKDDCQIVTLSNTKKCPSNTPSVSDIPSEIVTSGPYSYSYETNYSGDEYKDSLVINTITVDADTVDGGHQEVIGTATIKIGNPPEDCPSGAWPVAGNIGLNEVTQGPLAPSCSHQFLKNAIDIGIAGEPIIAVHSGIATVGEDSCVGKYIKITSTCGSTKFSSLYGHLGAVSIKNGQRVTLGQSLGISDNTGSCTTGSHLHFEFQTPSVPTVQKPYLIRNIPVSCCTRASCNP